MPAQRPLQAPQTAFGPAVHGKNALFFTRVHVCVTTLALRFFLHMKYNFCGLIEKLRVHYILLHLFQLKIFVPSAYRFTNHSYKFNKMIS